MRSRVLVYLSMALYGLFLVLPAIRPAAASPDAAPPGIPGGMLLFAVIPWTLVLFPLVVVWIAHPLLWTLWYLVLKRKETPGCLAWSVPLLALGTAAIMPFGLHDTPMIGLVFWVAASVTGALAATIVQRVEEP